MFLGLYLLFWLSFQMATGDVKQGCWPFNVVPYKIENDFTEWQLAYIQRQISQLHLLTCIRWVELSDEYLNGTDHAVFTKTTERTCYMDAQRTDSSYVMRITLSDWCFTLSAVIHEMLHVMGFDHEQKRSDRDCYIEVDQRAVNRTGKASQYSIQKQEEWLERFPYDKLSVMHYLRDDSMKALSERWYQFEPLGNHKSTLTFFDLWKIRYRFCNAPHYCDIEPLVCERMEQAEKKCRKNSILWDVANP